MTSNSNRLESTEKRLLANRFVVGSLVGIVVLVAGVGVGLLSLLSFIALAGALALGNVMLPLITERRALRADAERLRDEIARRARAEHAYARVNRALRVLSEANHELVRATGEPAFLHSICRLLVDVGGYRMGWVGLAQNDANKSVQPAAQAGFEDGYLERANITWADTERGRGPTGTAIRTGRPTINKLDDPAFEPWRAEAIKRGYAANIALPLVQDGVVFGVLGIYAAESRWAEEFLVRAGYRVLRASSPDEAIEIVLHTTGRLDLLLTDVIMPGMTGDRLRDVVAAMRPDIAALYMSGYPDDSLAERGVLLPGIQLLEKPFTRSQLLSKVRDVLDARTLAPLA